MALKIEELGEHGTRVGQPCADRELPGGMDEGKVHTALNTAELLPCACSFGIIRKISDHNKRWYLLINRDN